MKVHIIGLGITGSMLAWHLDQEGIDFTWEDAERSVCAWKATTGLIYPSGEPEDIEAYQIWSRWHREKSPWKLRGVTDEGAFWFITKSPPHSAHYAIKKTVGPLHLGEYSSFHLNGQAFVEGTREYFSSKRRSYTPTRVNKIIEAHGFNSRLEYFVWGWSARALLNVHPDVKYATDRKATFYLRRDRFSMSYANIIPGEPYYYAGSSTITQKVAKQYALDAKVQNWRNFVEETTAGLIKVLGIQDIRHGWRPATKTNGDYVIEEDGHLKVKPMRGSGVRHAPYVVRKLMEKIIN